MAVPFAAQTPVTQPRVEPSPSGPAASAFNAAQSAAAAAVAQQKKPRLEGPAVGSPRPPFVQAYTPMLAPGYGASQVCHKTWFKTQT